MSDEAFDFDSLIDFRGVPSGSAEEINVICDVLESVGITVPHRFRRGDSHVLGYHNDKMFRLELNGGIVVVPLTFNSPTESSEECFVYKTPEVGISWLLCKLDYGANASNFESASVNMQTSIQGHTVRLAFEENLTADQLAFYQAMGAGEIETADTSPSFGLNLLDKIKTPN